MIAIENRPRTDTSASLSNSLSAIIDQFVLSSDWHGIDNDELGASNYNFMLRSFPNIWRHMRKNRVSLVLNITGLAIGISVCLLIAIWAEQELVFDNFHPNVKNKFRISNTFKSEAETFSQAPSGVALGAQLPKHILDITSSCRVFNSSFKVRNGSEIHFESNVIIADSTFFTFFGFPIIAGSPQNLLRSPDHIVITRSAAVKYFGRVEEALGKTLLLDDQPSTVAAVAEDVPSNSHMQFDIVAPYKRLHAYALKEWKQDIDNMWLGGWPHTYIEIRDAAHSAKVESLVNEVVAEHSRKDWADNKMSYQYFLQPITDIHLHSDLRYDSPNNGDKMTVQVFISVAVLVLLLACFNYINLTAATSVTRAKEISLRKVSGATRVQLMRQFFGETFLTTALAVIVGVALAQLTLPIFSEWMGRPYWLPVDPIHGAALAAFVVIVTLLAGIYPSLVLSSFQPVEALRGRFFGSERGQAFRRSLVILQFSISTVLLICILTVKRQMDFINNKPLGYESAGVLTVNFNDDQAVQKNYDVISDHLLSMPYIERTTLHYGSVVGGLGNGWITTQDNQGKEIVTSIYRQSVDPDYFETFKMKFAAGRGFMRATSDSSKAVIVNEAAVRNLGWDNPELAIGKPFGKGEEVRYVIGVVEDFHFEDLHVSVQPLLIGYAQGGNSLSLRIRTDHIDDAISHLKAVWSSVVPEVPLQYTFVEESLEHEYENEQKMESIFYLFSGLSFFIACLGLFGLSTFMIRQRLREISIRKVLGASIPGLLTLLTRNFSLLVLISTLIACPVGYLLMNEWLSTFTYRTDIGWVVFVVALTMPSLIAILTVSAQAMKAALVNPAGILRSE
jgi:putative ABC transport system permease protein